MVKSSIFKYVQQNIKCITKYPTYENNNSINFLDLLIIRNQFYLEIDISETYNDRHHHHLLIQPPDRTQNCSLPLPYQQNADFPTNRRKTTDSMRNNNFPNTHIARLKTQIQHKTRTRTTKDENKKWATFTYHSPKVREITNLFKHTNINIAFKSTNTIQQSIKHKNPEKIPDYNRSGVYINLPARHATCHI